jgi:LysR family transcriptional regulator, nitrogen assimilation regulatory protein
MIMNLKQLECFVRVVELGSFTKAAAALDISQPVLSRQVRQLEIELKKHLLYRNGRGVTPSESGKRLVEHGKGILHQLELAKQDLEDEEAAPVGKVIVGLPPSVGKLMTVPLVSRFRELYSSASIGIVEGLTASMHEWLLLGRLDLAMLYNPLPTPQLEYERVWSEELYLISSAAAGKKLPRTLRMQDLGRYPLIIPSRSHAVRSLIETECGRQSIALNIALEIDSIPSVLDLVERGFGHAILTRNAIRGRPESGALTAARIVNPSITSHVVIATSAQRPLTTLARLTIGLMKSEIAGDLFHVRDDAAPARRARPGKGDRKRSA